MKLQNKLFNDTFCVLKVAFILLSMTFAYDYAQYLTFSINFQVK